MTENPVAAAVAPGYDFAGPALELGGLMLDKVVKSSTFKYAVRYAAREAVRGMFGIGRR